jgi:hypothetical protein
VCEAPSSNPNTTKKYSAAEVKLTVGTRVQAGDWLGITAVIQEMIIER